MFLGSPRSYARSSGRVADPRWLCRRGGIQRHLWEPREPWEAIEVIFDPSVLSYRKLLEFFFQIHDPTTRNRQGNDIGTSYRSAIFYLSEAQKRTAEKTIADIEASKVWPGKVVTEISPAGEFWAAEPEHQDYLQRFPHG